MKTCAISVAALAMLVVAYPAASSEASKLMPTGLWEIKMKMEMPGMPPEIAAKMGEGRVMRQCVTTANQKKWSDVEAAGPMGRNGKCERVEPVVSGNKTSWSVKCQDGTTGDGSVTHNGKDSFSVNMAMTSPRGSMTMSGEGRRVAETCEK